MNKEVQILKEMPVRIPVNGTFELTVRCNLHCKMCLFRHDDSENAEIMAKELTTEQWIDMARQAAEAGTMSLLITGGEPMLRPDFCEIWEGIYKQGFIITLYTNATLVTPKIMETLRKYPPHKIGITIYGASAATYEKVTYNSEAFYRMISGVKELIKLPSIIEFRTTLINDNYLDMSNMDNLVKSEFGKEFFISLSSHVHQSVRGACSDVNTCRLNSEKLHSIRMERLEMRARQIIGDSFDKNRFQFIYNENKDIPRECKETKQSLIGCKAGMDSYTISWDGLLLGCQLLDAFFTDAKVYGLLKAWEKFPFEIRLPKVNSKCVNCPVATYCQSCYASRLAETGSLNGCSTYLYSDANANKKLIHNLMRRSKYETNEL